MIAGLDIDQWYSVYERILDADMHKNGEPSKLTRKLKQIADGSLGEVIHTEKHDCFGWSYDSDIIGVKVNDADFNRILKTCDLCGIELYSYMENDLVRFVDYYGYRIVEKYALLQKECII